MFSVKSKMEYADYLLYERCAAAVRKERVLRDHRNPYDFLSDEEFRERFRLRKHVFIEVLKRIDDGGVPIICETKCSLTLMQEFLVCLQYMSTNKFQLSIADEFGITQPTVSRIFWRMVRQVSKLAESVIRFPSDLNEVKEGFQAVAGFPAVIGAIDGTHIPIISPGGPTAEIYRNRKGFFSINVQAVCNSSLIFTDITARWHGSAHDSRVFDSSIIRDRMESGELDGYLIGDSGYPGRSYLLTPVINTVTESERRYNIAHKRTRVKIECTFGVWKRRFPILSIPIRVKLSTVPHLIVATAVLHNYALTQNDTSFFDDSFTQDADASDTEDENSNLAGISERDTFVRRFFGEERPLL